MRNNRVAVRTLLPVVQGLVNEIAPLVLFRICGGAERAVCIDPHHAYGALRVIGGKKPLSTSVKCCIAGVPPNRARRRSKLNECAVDSNSVRLQHTWVYLERYVYRVAMASSSRQPTRICECGLDGRATLCELAVVKRDFQPENDTFRFGVAEACSDMQKRKVLFHRRACHLF
eukprot:CAMPEP_0119301342 /NCGR_PEP_ID=MMETSP1333-20130426/3138_1 /TAXON_ID=418940 /ORGANISM="Scyphosphaera apsteinii, Strain RCC1455" /LENGTH=172 /DNA_ID=CAMNT_0007303391 /DNA_START=1183 /DNA_END=1701 /DNA_ORIENTATION=+